MEWLDIPPFAVLTGENGVGKSQFLEVIAHTFGAYRYPSWSDRMKPPPISARAQIEGCSFANGEVFHSRGEWQPVAAGNANIRNVQEVLGAMQSDMKSSSQVNDDAKRSILETIASTAGLNMGAISNLPPDEFTRLLTPGLVSRYHSPYVWGVTKDATGSFRAALIGASVVVVVEALVILYVRARVMSERRLRAAAIEQPLAVPS